MHNTLELSTLKCDDGYTGHLRLQLELTPEWPFLTKEHSTGLKAQMAPGQVPALSLHVFTGESYFNSLRLGFFICKRGYNYLIRLLRRLNDYVHGKCLTLGSQKQYH